jgi:hypothetical protein
VDNEKHFQALLPAFLDKRYVKVDGKPLFLVYSPAELPDPKGFTALWQHLAQSAGLPGIYFVGGDNEPWTPSANGFDGATVRVLHLAQRSEDGSLLFRFKQHYRRWRRRPPKVLAYHKSTEKFLLPECSKVNVYPCVVPNWDNTPRSGLQGMVLHSSTPELFRKHLRNVLQQVQPKPPDHRLVFVKSWNEWAEGNHLEPDLKFGRQYLDVLQEEISRGPLARNGASAASRHEERQPALATVSAG